MYRAIFFYRQPAYKYIVFINYFIAPNIQVPVNGIFKIKIEKAFSFSANQKFTRR